MDSGRRFAIAAAILLCLQGAASAQLAITSGPNYCCWRIGEVNHALTATGGTGGYTWTLAAGSLPPGLAIRTDVPNDFPAGTSAGLIGVATAEGTYNFTLRVTSNGQSVTQSATMRIASLTLDGPFNQFPDAFVNVPLPSYQLTAFNNAGPVTYTLSNSTLPPGITLSLTGVLSGTPTTPGSYSWIVQFTDGVDTQFWVYNINVYAIDITTPGQLPNAIQNAAYRANIAASGGVGGYTFTSSSLPNGLLLTSSGVISGTVTAGPERWSVTVTATDRDGTSYSKPMAIDVIAGPQYPEIGLYGNGNWDDCTVGTYCSRDAYSGAGIAPFTWLAAGLPPGMSIRSGSGTTGPYIVPGDVELWGVPISAGVYNVRLTVTDATGASATNTFPLNVSNLIVDGGNLVNGAVGVSYSSQLRVLGGDNSYSVTQTGGLLADGLSLNTGNLLVTGTPLENGSFFAVFQFSDAASTSIQATNYYTIGGGASTITIGTSYNLGTSTLGSTPNLDLYACCAPGYTWNVAGGAPPPGLSLSASGNLSGTLNTAGIYTFLVCSTDTTNSANTGCRQFVLVVTPTNVTTGSTLPYGNTGVSYAQTLTATGGMGTLTWTLDPYSYLPPGLTLSKDGTISGTPTQTGQFLFNVTVTDTAQDTGTWSFTISVYPGAVTRFVAPNGNDSNPGTISQPYLTIQRCATAVFGGSACMVRAGTYHETVTPNSGITIASYNGETVTVDGSDPVTGWSLYQGSIYQASVTLATDDTNQVFVGNQMMTEARWPNGNDLFHVNWATAQAGTTTSQLVDSNLSNIDWTGAKIHFLSGIDPYFPETATVTGSAPGQLAFSLDYPSVGPDVQPQPGGYYYLYRFLGALDTQGEWFYDPTAMILYFWAPGNANPNTLNVRAKRRQYAFDLSGASNVTIQNIDIFASTINMDSSSFKNTLTGINAQYVSQFTDLCLKSGCDYPPGNLQAQQDHSMDSGIILNGSGNTLENSTIAWSAGNGVALAGSNNTVANNLIYNTGYTGNNAVGISLFGTGHSVQYNTVHTGGRYLISITGNYPNNNPNNNDISFNNVFNAMLLGSDGGGIYSAAFVTGTRIHNNWVHDTQEPAFLATNKSVIDFTDSGVYLDEDANGFEVDQNVIWNNEYFNIALHGSSQGVILPFDNYIHNNSIPDVGTYAYIWLNSVVNCGTTLIQDNVIFQPITQTSTDPECTAINNNSTAPGATEMTSSVQVGCKFTGCSSGGPPAISGSSVAASIAVQPLSAMVAAGQTAIFTVTAAGSPTITYQWQRNGVDIPGATGATYTTPSTTSADNGALFAVSVGNSVGSATSDPATLTVEGGGPPAPFFSGQMSLGSGVEYLQFPNNSVFGYYNFVASSIFYHYDMGYEAFIPGSAADIYLYDFTSKHWWYTSTALFPYLYDFTLNSWLYYFPNTTSPGHYTTNPRDFSNLTTGKIITM